MGKSKHRKNHKEKLAKYKTNKKIEQDLLKKNMIENYLKIQQQSLANQQEHTSTEEVVGPEINLDDLNMVEEFQPINVDDLNMTEEFETINIDQVEDSNVEWEKLEGSDFNQPLNTPIQL